MHASRTTYEFVATVVTIVLYLVAWGRVILATMRSGSGRLNG